MVDLEVLLAWDLSQFVTLDTQVGHQRPHEADGSAGRHDSKHPKVVVNGLKGESPDQGTEFRQGRRGTVESAPHFSGVDLRKGAGGAVLSWVVGLFLSDSCVVNLGGQHKGGEVRPPVERKLQ